MGSMQQAVLEFDEAVLAPWRPKLRAEEVVDRPRLRALPPPTPSRSPSRSGSRSPRPAAPRPAGPRASRPEPRGPRPAGGGATLGPGRRSAGARPARGSGGPACRPASAGRLRLTARGRALLTVLALAAGMVLAAVVGVVADDDGALRLAGESVVVVQPGDTVWDIAVAVSGDDDVRDVVDEIQRLNGLDGTALVPGQTLRLP